MVRAALVGYGNDAGVRSVVIQIGTGVIGLKGVILGLVRQGSSILAVLFGYLDVVVTGDSELALGRDTGNRQLNRAAAGQRIRSCLDSDCRSSLFSPLSVVSVACFEGSCRDWCSIAARPSHSITCFADSGETCLAGIHRTAVDN